MTKRLHKVLVLVGVGACVCWQALPACAQDQGGKGKSKAHVSSRAEQPSDATSEQLAANLRKQLNDQESQIQKLKEQIERDRRESSSVIDDLLAQRKLLQEEQAKLVDSVVDYKRKLGSISREGTPTSERERVLSEELKKTADELGQKNQQLEQSRSDGDALQNLLIAHKALKRTLADKEEDIAKLNQRIAEATAETGNLKSQVKDQQQWNVTLKAREERVAKLEGELKQANEIIKALEVEKEGAKQLTQRVSDLEGQLAEARNLVMLKETELRMLNEMSNVNPGRSAQVTSRQNMPLQTQQQPVQQYVPRQAQQQMVNSVPARSQVQSQGNQQSGNDVLIVQVIEDKVNLRSGPGNENAPVMQVQKGSRLTVEARQGDWFRVLTPTGSRAFVHKDYVLPEGQQAVPSRNFSRAQSSGANTSSTEEGSPEDAQKAFEALKAGISKQ